MGIDEKELSYLILGSRGGVNRVKMIKLLEQRPYNINQMAKSLDLNYRTVQHHIDLLQDHGIVKKSESNMGYGDVYDLRLDLNDKKKLDGVVKRLEEKMELTSATNSLGFFSKLLKQTNEGVIVLDRNLEVFFCNKSAEKLMRYKSGDMNGMKMDMIFPEGVYTIIEKKIQENEKIQNFKFDTKTLNGKGIDLSLNMDPVKNEEGNVIGYLLLLRDRTKQSRLEKKYKQTIDRYTFIFNESTNMNIIMDKNGKISDTNPIAKEVLGFNSRELRKVSFRDLVVPNHRSRFDSIVDSIRKDGWEGPNELDIVSKDGTIMNICLKSGEAIPDIGLRKDEITLVCEDMTEIRKLENGISKATVEGHRLKQNLEAIAKSTPLGVTIIDAPDGKVSFINDRAKELYGNSELNVNMTDHSDKFGLLDTDGKPFPPKDLPASRALLKGEFVENEEVLIKRPDGVILHVLVNATPIKDENGNTIQAAAMFWDITDLKKTKQELDIYKVELENQNQELRKSQEELESSRNEYSDLFDYSPLGLFKLDEFGLILDVNMTASDLFNKPRKHLLERPVANLFPDHKNEIRRMLRDVNETGEKKQIRIGLDLENGERMEIVLTASMVKKSYELKPFCYLTMLGLDD
mgnify:CR=1 FL=1